MSRTSGSNNYFYSKENDEQILEAVENGKAAGIPLGMIFDKLSDELDPPRSSNAIYNRYKKHLATDRPEQIEFIPGGDDEPGDVLSQVRKLVKERDYYKKHFEMMKGDYDRLNAEVKAIKEIRRVLGRIDTE